MFKTIMKLCVPQGQKVLSHLFWVGLSFVSTPYDLDNQGEEIEGTSGKEGGWVQVLLNTGDKAPSSTEGSVSET